MSTSISAPVIDQASDCLSSTLLGLPETAQKARAIAKQCLKFNVASISESLGAESKTERHFLLAGGHQYRCLWARDLAMSVQGAMEGGEQRAVRDSLGLFFSFQRSDGLLPRHLDYYDITRRVILGVLGAPLEFKWPLKPWFKTENGVVSIDGNVALVWAASRYLQFSKDREAAEKWLSPAEKAIHFVETQYLEDGLVGRQPPFSDWADSIRRSGRVAYTNVLYILALKGLSAWASWLGQVEKASYYSGRALKVEGLFLEFFWNSKKQILSNFEGNRHWSADANLMAVAHGILPKDLSMSVMEQLRTSPLWSPIPGRPTWPDYPSVLKSWLVKFVSLGGYHDQFYWPWLSSLAAIAEKSIGNRTGYQKILGALAHQIVTDQSVHEVYELGTAGALVPVKRLFYSSEKPFTWSAALFLEALAFSD